MASERIEERERGRFEASVEATRIGTVAAFDKRAATRWRGFVARAKRQSSMRGAKGLTGAGLEQAVMRIAQLDPGLVAVRAA